MPNSEIYSLFRGRDFARVAGEMHVIADEYSLLGTLVAMRGAGIAAVPLCCADVHGRIVPTGTRLCLSGDGFALATEGGAR